MHSGSITMQKKKEKKRTFCTRNLRNWISRHKTNKLEIIIIIHTQKKPSEKLTGSADSGWQWQQNQTLEQINNSQGNRIMVYRIQNVIQTKWRIPQVCSLGIWAWLLIFSFISGIRCYVVFRFLCKCLRIVVICTFDSFSFFISPFYKRH